LPKNFVARPAWSNRAADTVVAQAGNLRDLWPLTATVCRCTVSTVLFQTDAWRPDGAAARVPALEVLALVILSFAFADRQRDLHPAVFPKQRERNDGMAFDRGQLDSLRISDLCRSSLRGAFGAWFC